MGYYTNSVKLEWPENDDGRIAVLLEDVAYVDDEGRTWQAHKGDKVNGASIPRMFWRIVGGPMSGKYRYASVIHDVFCVTKSMPHKDVHQMFDEAMQASGVPEWKRKAMARAVKMFGPKW